MERTNNEGTIGVNMSLGHGIIFGGMQEREDNGDRRIHLESQKDEEKPEDGQQKLRNELFGDKEVSDAESCSCYKS